MRTLIILAALAALTLTAGCGKKADKPAADKAAATEKAATEEAATEEAATEEAATEEAAPADEAPAPAAMEAAQAPAVTAEGTKFEPPIEKDQVPAGAWFCDMGTVHYASLDKKDGTCPLCKMQLKHKP